MARLAVALALSASLAPAAALGYGEPDGQGRPSREERLLLALTNEVRAAPHTWPDWDTSLASGEPRAALGGLPGMFEAARFHADDMATHDFFAHESGDGTSFEARIGRYFQGAAGENIYAASHAGGYEAITAWMNSPGHRANILRPEWTWLGTGYARGSGRHYYVQDFGQSRDAAIPPIPAAASRLIPIDQLELVANYWDPQGRAPKSVAAELGGRRHELARRAGEGGNATYAAMIVAPRACEKLVFTAEDATGAPAVYPSTGAFLAGAACTAEYTTETPALSTLPIIIDAEDRGCRCARPGGATPWILGLIFAMAIRRRR